MLPTVGTVVVSCPVCLSALNPSVDDNRPSILPCGHTICTACFKLTKARASCPVCKEYYDPYVVQKNFKLEEQIHAVHKAIHTLNTDFASCKNTSLCTNCRTIYRNIPKDPLASMHKTHNTLSLQNISESRAEESIWLLEVLNRGPDIKERFEKILQAILEIAYQYQQALDIFTSETSEDSTKFEEAMLHALEAHIKMGDEVKTVNQHSGLAASLVKLRSIQKDMAKPYINLKQKFSQDIELDLDSRLPKNIRQNASEPVFIDSEKPKPEDSKKFSEFIAAIEEDPETDVLFLAASKDLNLLPSLTHELTNKHAARRTDPRAPKPPSPDDGQPSDGVYLAKRLPKDEAQVVSATAEQ